MAGFFERDDILYFVRPRFLYSFEYAALVLEIAGFACALANAVFLITKLRAVPTSLLFRSLLAVTLCVIVFNTAHFFLIYFSFSRAALTATTWSCTAAQVLIVFVKANSIKLFVPNIRRWIINCLYAANTWYRATNAFWPIYVAIYDLGICTFVALKIAALARRAIKIRQQLTSTTAPSTTRTSEPDSAQVWTTSAQVQAEFRAKVRNTAISLFGFLLIGIVNIYANVKYSYYQTDLSPYGILAACAYVQICVACAGPHIVFVSLMLHNISQIVASSYKKLIASKNRTAQAAGANIQKAPNIAKNVLRATDAGEVL
nr:hypothetical protein HK105_002814 [Polyrhizophydium stewartii]